jgi:hypothetical protein
MPLGDRMVRNYFTLHRTDWRDAADQPGGIEFNLPVSGWFRLFAGSGFTVEGYHELRAPAPGSEIHDYVTGDWAYRFPCEQVWELRRSDGDGS